MSERDISSGGTPDAPGVANEYLGERIRRMRTERGLAQDRLAIEAHVDQSGLSKFERGKNRQLGVSALRRIAEVLGVTYEALIQGTDM